MIRPTAEEIAVDQAKRAHLDGDCNSGCPHCDEVTNMMKYFSKEQEKMKSGIHTHKCTQCGIDKYCPQITHCQKPDESICLDCEYPLEKREAANERK